MAQNLLEQLVDPKSHGLPDWRPKLELNGEMGGCVCVADLQGKVRLKAFIGKIPEDKLDRYWDLAERKAGRLWVNRLEREHLSSWQSRDPRRDWWGGAIKTPTAIYSFSGLTEEYDEAFMLLLAMELTHLSSAEACRIAEISSNPHWKQLLRRYTSGQ